LLLPTAAVAIGLRLRVPKGAAIWRPLGAVVGAKLVLMPAVAVAVCVGAGVTGDAAAVVVLQAAMPTMMTVGALLALAGVAVELSTAAVTVTTLVSMLTLPLWSGLVAALWP
jgi:predicted permease